MKRIFLIIILIYSLSLKLVSQVDIGLKFGFNISNIVESKSIDGLEDFGELDAIHLGMFGDFTLNSRLNLQAEIFVIGKGYDARAVGADFQLLYNYIATPVLLKTKLVPRLSVLGGLEPSYKLGTYWANGLEFQNVSEGFKEYRKFDLGFVAGLAFKFAKKWSLDLRLTRGVLFANPDIFPVYNRTFCFSVHRCFGDKEN